MGRACDIKRGDAKNGHRWEETEGEREGAFRVYREALPQNYAPPSNMASVE